MRDLTKGSIEKVILQFAFPIFLGQIIQLFYSITDTWIIGSLLGSNALAAVGSVCPISDMIVGFLIGLTNGFAVIAARFFGADDKEGLNKSFGASLVFGTIITLILTFVSVAFLPQLLDFVNIAPEHVTDGTAYIKIILLGMFASMLYNAFAGILRATGDTIAPLLFLLVSTILNVYLNYLFISAVHMGVAGSSTATIISQLFSAALCAVYIYKRYPVLHLHKNSFAISSKLAKQICASGLSMGLMSSLVALGTLILQSSINTFSNNTIVAHYAARKLTSIFMTPFVVLGTTMASYCSQNFGAYQFDRIKAGIKKSIFYSGIWCVVVVVISYTIVPFLIQAITSTKVDEVIQTSTLYLRIDTLLYFVPAVISIVRNALQGIGDHFTPIISSGIELGGKFLTVIFLAPRLHYMGIILSEPIVWVLMVIPLLIKLKNSTAFSKAKAFT